MENKIRIYRNLGFISFEVTEEEKNKLVDHDLIFYNNESGSWRWNYDSMESLDEIGRVLGVTPKTESDVKNDYTDDDNYTHIDLYEGEEGRTIAIVCRDTRKVYHIDNTLRGDETVQAKIKEVLDQLKENSILTYNLIEHDLKVAGEYLSGDEDVKDQVIAILEHCDQAEENEDDFIDDVEGVCVWQKVEYEFTCRQFLRHIQVS